jgi:pilus assembly protein CpaB
MKQAQLIGFGVAGVAALAAVVIMSKFVNRPVAKPAVVTQVVDSVRVLVARSDLPLGSITTEQSFRWQDWPKDSISPSFVTSAMKPQADKDYANFIARSPVLAGEPITDSKVIKSGSGGVLAAILPPGMRAVATKISEQSAAGRLILPNDHVDLILIQRKRSKNGSEEVNADTLFRNVRILAIGQQLETKDGKKTAEGNVAVLEMTPKQSEMLALANTMGEISLALRSVADLNGDGPESLNKQADRGSVRVLRYGVKSRVYGTSQ